MMDAVDRALPLSQDVVAAASGEERRTVVEKVAASS
jgi:hypothetical protein